jgi:FtsH-binding integral membrane protein
MGTKYFPLFGESRHASGDVETGNALYPGISATENEMRLGFIRKVFGIVTAQLLLTAAIALIIVLNPSTQQYLASSPGIQIGLMLASMLGLIPLYMYKDRHPLNLGLLAAWTSVFSVTVGLACTFYAPIIVIQAVFITAAVVGGLTMYTFAATRRGEEFTWLGPILFSALWALIIWSFLQLVFKPGPVGETIFSLLGALVFCGYIVFDVHLLATRLDVDDYVWGSVALYLDVVNLFLYIMRIMGDRSNN